MYDNKYVVITILHDLWYHAHLHFLAINFGFFLTFKLP